jgi:hypothetical protein
MAQMIPIEEELRRKIESELFDVEINNIKELLT